MSLEIETAALRAVPLFRNTEMRALQLLAFMSEIVTFHPGEALCVQGERGDAAYVVLEGAAEVWVAGADGGERRLVGRIGRHEVVGEIAVLCDIPRTADVIAVSELKALRIGKELMLRMLRDAPDMALEVMRALAVRLHETTMALSQARAAG